MLGSNQGGYPGCKYYYDSDNVYAVYYDTYNNSLVSAIRVLDLEAGDPAVPSSDSMNRSFELQVFDLTNSYRVSHDLNPLIWSDEASTAARKHSIDMYERNFFDHINPDGLDPADRMEAEGISGRDFGENIINYTTNPTSAVYSWVNSYGHLLSILKDYTHLGVGVDHRFYTQNFYTTY